MNSRLRQDKKGMVHIAFLVLALIIAVVVGMLVYDNWIKGGQPLSALGGDSSDDSSQSEDGENTCDNYWGATTVTFVSSDKYTGDAIGGNHQYKIGNDATTNSVANAGTASLSPRSKLSVLMNQGNNTYSNVVLDHEVACAPTDRVVLQNSVKNDTALSVQCFNQEGNIIDDVGENETIGAGEAPTLKCQVFSSSQSATQPGVLVVELAKSAYKESDVRITGFVNSFGDVPNAHDPSATTNTARAFVWPGTEDANTYEFFITIPAETGTNPSDTQDVLLYLYTENGYEEEDLIGNPFETDVEDIDGTAQGLINGMLVETIQVD